MEGSFYMFDKNGLFEYDCNNTLHSITELIKRIYYMSYDSLPEPWKTGK